MNQQVSPKKLREKQLIDAFIAVTPAFGKYQFAFYDENPDLVYSNNDRQLGFESILVVPTRKSQCQFDPSSCELKLPTNHLANIPLVDVQLELTRTLFDHLRHYKLPTVIVFTLTSKNVQLEAVAAHFRLPEVSGHNILDYYLTDGERSIQIVETGRW